MRFDSRTASASAVFLVAGLVLGGGLTFYHMESQIESLENRVEAVEDAAVAGAPANYSGGYAYNDIFRMVDQSVVSIRAYGAQGSQGSGFVYSSDGYIVTNAHVVEGADRVEVGFLDGTTRNARIVGTDPYTDLAVLKVNKRGLRPLELGDSSQVRVGQPAVAIGNPFGLRSSMTAGIISQKGRSLRTQGGFSTPNVLQTDAAINPGNSGGPLLNTEGEVVGVNTAIESRTGTFSGVGFAIPSNTVSRVVPSIIEDGDHEHSWIGISGLDVNPGIAEAMELENTTGFLVMEVVDGSPADRAGLTAGERVEVINDREVLVGGDVIVEIDDQKIRGINDLLLYLARETSPGDTVEVTVIREGERVDIPVELSARSDRSS